MVFYVSYIFLELLKCLCGSTFFWCLGVSIILNVSSFDMSSCKSIFIIHFFFLRLLDLQKHMCISILISTCMSKCSLPLARLYPSHSHKLPIHRDKLQDLDQLEEAGFFCEEPFFFCGQWMLRVCAESQYPSFLSGWITCEMATGREVCGEGCGRARNVWTSVGFQLRHFEIHNPSIWI